MIILVSGKQGSGKTTLIEELKRRMTEAGHNVVLYSIKQPIGECSNACWDVMERYGFKRPDVKDGRLEQLLGTEWGRETIASDVWVQCAKNRIKTIEENHAAFMKQICCGPALIIMIDSVRFPNEIEAFPKALKIRLTCPVEIRKERCGSTWREKPHVSEHALDDYKDWDITFPTDRFTVGECAAVTMTFVEKKEKE